VASNATLDLSELGDACTVASFTGQGGKLLLSSSGLLTVTGNCTGTTALGIYGNAPALYSHQYIQIEGSSDVSFTFTAAQSDMTLDSDESKKIWTTSESDWMVALEKFDLQDTTINASTFYGSTISATATFAEDSSIQDIGAVPLTYQVTYGGQTFTPDTLADEYDYYWMEIPELNLKVTSVDSLDLEKYDPDYAIPTGDYKFTITAPTVSGDVTRTATLTVIDDVTPNAADTATAVTVSSASVSYGETVTVTAKISAGGADVDGGTALLYINGAAQESATVNSGVATWTLPATEDRLQLGQNRLFVRYCGNDSYSASLGGTEVAMTKADVRITYTGADASQNCEYTGAAAAVDLGSVQCFNNATDQTIAADPEIVYTNDRGKVVTPVLPGAYQSSLRLTETDYYNAAQTEGPTLTITATPTVNLSQPEGGDTVRVEVDGVLGSHIPAGTVQLYSDGSTLGDAVELADGVAEIPISGSSQSVYAIYTPASDAPYTVKQSDTLTLTPTEQTTWIVTEGADGTVTVTFHNLTDQSIQSAVLLVAAYQGGRLQTVLIEDPVTVAPGKAQSFNLSFANIPHDELRAFLCDSLSTLRPLCDSDSSKA
jgi:hypothetical protein